MKKFLSFILVAVLGIVLYMPNALAEKVEFSCKKDCELTASDTCVSTCTFGISGNTKAITQWRATITLSPADKVQMGTVTLNSGWQNLSTTPNVIELVSSDMGGVSDANITFGTFTVTMPRDLDGESCSIKLQPEGMEVVEQTVTTETQPSTGVTLPIIVLTCGLAVAIGAYYVTRKSTKMYKI